MPGAADTGVSPSLAPPYSAVMKTREEVRLSAGTKTEGRVGPELPPDFSQWFRDHQPTVYRYVRFRLANREAAEDVTSQVFMKALRALDRYDPAGRLREPGY